MVITIEQKAQMFDALVAQLTRPEWVGEKRIPANRNPSVPADWPDVQTVGIEYKRIPVYEWKFRSDGCSNFIDACFGLLPKEAG